MPSTPPNSLDRIKVKSERLKQWATIIAIVVSNIAAIVTAISAHFKEEKGAKNVYKELSSAVEKVSDDQVQLHKDVSAMRGYLAGMAQKSKEPMVLWNPKEDKPVVAKKPATTTRRPPIRVGIGIPKPKAKPEPITVLPPPQAPPPNITPEPDDYDAPPEPDCQPHCVYGSPRQSLHS